MAGVPSAKSSCPAMEPTLEIFSMSISVSDDEYFFDAEAEASPLSQDQELCIEGDYERKSSSDTTSGNEDEFFDANEGQKSSRSHSRRGSGSIEERRGSKGSNSANNSRPSSRPGSSPGSRHNSRSGSPNDGCIDDIKDIGTYTQLKHLAGLTSPSPTPFGNDETYSQKESVISSLSSGSEKVPMRAPRRNSSNETESDILVDLRKEISETSANFQTPNFPSPMANNGLHYTASTSTGPAISPSIVMPRFTSRRSSSSTNPQFKLPDEEEVFEAIFQQEHEVLPGANIKVSRSSKAPLIKDKLCLVQTLDQMHDGPIWTMKFAPDGQFLATGGQDTKVIIWCIGEIPQLKRKSDSPTGSPDLDDASSDSKVVQEDRMKNLNEPDELFKRPIFSTQNQEMEISNQLIGPFIINEPYRILEGHQGDITDISWSKSGFLLSASTDKIVKLWHVTRNDCLQFFKHADIVTAVEFHPDHDRYFISGCFDRRIRVWDIIPDGYVKEWAQTHETITSVAFSPDGRTVAAGLIQGQVFFYEYEGMKYRTQMSCRNKTGTYKKGAKVTGITFLADNGYSSSQVASSSAGNQQSKRKPSNTRPGKLLVTTNDSRIRLCRLEDYAVNCKFKGLSNKSMQIRASVSEDHKYLISGSDTGEVFIWNTTAPTTTPLFFSSDVKKTTTYESFSVTNDSSAAICASFAPVKSVRRYLKTRSRALLNIRGATVMTTTDSSTPHREQSVDNDVEIPEGQLCELYGTRIIVTADSSGLLKVFFRMM